MGILHLLFWTMSKGIIDSKEKNNRKNMEEHNNKEILKVFCNTYSVRVEIKVDEKLTLYSMNMSFSSDDVGAFFTQNYFSRLQIGTHQGGFEINFIDL